MSLDFHTKSAGFHVKSAEFHEYELLGDHQVQVFLSKDQSRHLDVW